MSFVLLSGLAELSAADRKRVVAHAMDKSHYTHGGDRDKVKKRTTPEASTQTRTPGPKAESSSTELVAATKEKQKFVIPVPGKYPKDSMAGQTFVLTGLFPEIGGGVGLSQGKDRAKKMIQSFGGKVAAAVSGKTDVLVVGKEPGMSKVLKARKSPKISMVSLHDLKLGLERGNLEDGKAKPMMIRSFSKGFGQRKGGPNGHALRASKEELAIASGSKRPALDSKPARVKKGEVLDSKPARVAKRPAAQPAKKRRLG